MVVASLLATVAFQASLSPPSAVWSDDYSVDFDGNPTENPHKADDDYVASNLSAYFYLFCCIDRNNTKTSENYVVSCDQNFTYNMAGDDGTRFYRILDRTLRSPISKDQLFPLR
ncbi:hypothetical protein REPUB_Repub03eG0043800 [Reevesia pubescens]